MNSPVPQIKAAVSISEMAKMVGLSRQRFAQLRGSTFPDPDYDPISKRPFYSAEKQQICLDVRRRNCGIDGNAILFYSRRSDFSGQTSRRLKSKPSKPTSQHAGLMVALQSLGLANVTAAQIDEAMAELYPNGTEGIVEGEVIRSIFVRLHRKNS